MGRLSGTELQPAKLFLAGIVAGIIVDISRVIVAHHEPIHPL